MVIPNILKNIWNNQQIILPSGKGLIFNPLYITDMIKILDNLLESSGSDNLNIFNVYGQETIYLAQIVHAAYNFFNKKPQIINSKQSATHTVADNTKIRYALQMSSTVLFKDGICDTLKSFNKLIS